MANQMRQVDITPDLLPSSCITKKVNVASEFSEILRLSVPRGQVWKLDASRAFLLYLGFVETIASGGTGEIEFVTTHAPARVVDAARTYTDGLFQHVAAKDDGTAYPVSAVIDHIDGGTYSITATGVITDEDHQVCYVPWINGELVVRAESPRGYGEIAKAVFVDNLKHIHAMNQELENKVAFNALLPPDYMLAFYLTSSVLIAWENGATSGGIDIPFARFRIPMWIMPERMFYTRDERAAGEKLRAQADTLLSRR